MIGYVYLVCLLMLALLREVGGGVIDLIGLKNILWLRNSIARERGIAAYRAWAPLERIRPAHIPQAMWEETYAWPANDKPPYPPLRILRGFLSYVLVAAAIAVLLQILTPFPVLAWLASRVR